MRVFIAVDLPKEVKDELYGIQKLIFPSLAKIKWVPKKNLHLTLKFLGEVADVDEIDKKLSEINFKPFEASLGKFGIFKNKKEIRVLWVDLEPHKNIIDLQQEIDSELLSLFGKYQKFSPHLTLGRIKSIKKEKEFLKSIEEIKVNPIKFKINEFQLVQSILSKDGSKFKVLKEYKA